MPNLTRLLIVGLSLFATTIAHSQFAQLSSNPFNQSIGSFIENKGQIKDQNARPRTDIGYYLALKDLSVFVGEGALHYQFYKSTNHSFHDRNSKKSLPTETYRLDVSLDGANIYAPVVTSGNAVGKANFCRSRSQKVIAAGFTKLTYKDIYPGIDWEIYTAGNELKYDFIIHQGADPSLIRLRIDGATATNINADGGFSMITPFGTIGEKKPYSYERATKRTIASNFHKKGNYIGFTTGNFSGDLVIDPTIIWATYYGGAGIDEVYKLKNDVLGNVFITGITSSAAYIATSGSHQQTIDGNFDAFVARFDKGGSLQWATYFGGEGDDYATSLFLNKNGQVVITGATTSAWDMATTGSHQQVYGGDANGVTGDAFVAKFDVDGTRLWSTYLGGHEADCGNAIVCDAGGNIYVAGMTTSNTNIATPASYRNLLIGPLLGAPPPDAFLVKFSSNGQRLWGTYFGGDLSDLATGLAINERGDLYLAGETLSPNLGTSGVFQSTFAGGASDAFVVRFSADGEPSWCTYFGGSEYEHPTDIIIAGQHSIYLAGSTYGDGRMTTSSAHQPLFGGGGGDGFLTRFSENGEQIWGTFYGGNGFDQINGITEDSLGNIIATGFTSSNNNMVQSPGSGRSQVLVNSSTPEGFVAKFNTTGQRIWGTYFSGVGKSVGSYGNGHIYFTGYTVTTGLATSGVHQQMNRGNGDVLLARIDDDTTVFLKEPFTDTSYCMGAFFRLPYDVSSKFSANNEFVAQLSDATGNFNSGAIIGRVSSATAGTIGCQLPIGATGSGYKVRVIATHPIDTSIAASKTIHIIQGSLSTPSVSIISDPVTPVPGQSATFTVSIADCANNTGLQWYVNGQPVAGAVSNPYTRIFGEKDEISVVAYCQSTCSTRDSAISNHITLQVVNPLAVSGLTVFPNPSGGTFNITGTTQAQQVDLEIYNVVGQMVKKQALLSTSGRISERVVMNDVSAGVYIVKLHAGDQTSVAHIVVSK